MPAINWLAVLVCGILSMVVGFLWYGNFLFGPAWSRYTGWTEEKIRALPSSNMGITYGWTFVLALILAATLASGLAGFGQTAEIGVVEGILFSVLRWGGFVAATQGVNMLFDHKPLGLFAITAGYHLVLAILFGII